MRKRYLSILMACAMLLTSVPASVFAEETTPVDTTAETVTVESDVDAEDTVPDGNDNVTAEVPTEQVQQDVEASDETVQPNGIVSDGAEEDTEGGAEIIGDEAELFGESTPVSEIAEESGDEFVDESGLIDKIEVVENDSAVEMVELTGDTQKLEPDTSTKVTLSKEDNDSVMFAVDPGWYIMEITEYEGNGNVYYSTYNAEEDIYGSMVDMIYCPQGNSWINFYLYWDTASFTVTIKKVNATPLALNGTYSIPAIDTGKYRLYSFKPTVSGRYTMYMDGQNKTSVAIEVYEESSNNNSYLATCTEYLTAGKTYYYLVSGNYNQYVSACTMHFIQTPTVTGATLTAMPTKREFVKKVDSHVNPKGMKVKLVYSNGSTKEIEYNDDYYYYGEEVEDDYGNYVEFHAYDKDIKGNIDYGTDIGSLDSDQPSGVYDMGAVVYTYSGNRSVLFTRIIVPFTIVDKGQHIHIWGAWTNTATGQTRKCELCGATETKSKPAQPVLELTANKLTMKKGQTTNKFKVTKMIAGDSLASVKSSDNKTLKVSNVKANGTFKLKALKVTGKKKVKLTITLKSGLSKTVNVTIQSANVKTTKVKVDKKLTLKVKKKVKLKSVITPVTSQDKVKYKSSNTKVATVNAKGVVTAKKAGKAKITVQSGSKKAVCTVTVKKK